jgi:hypothetical protein
MQEFMRLSLYDNMRLKEPKIAGKDGFGLLLMLKSNQV